MTARDNAQLTSVPDTDKAWLAGFTDGEGHLSLVKNYRNTNVPGIATVYTRYHLTNTHRASIDWAQSIIQRLTGDDGTLNTVVHGGHRPRYDLWVSAHASIRKICEAILPYSTCKVEQIKTMLAYLDIAPTRKGRKPGVSRFGDEHYALVDRINALNKRYAPGEWNAAARDRTASPDLMVG